MKEEVTNCAGSGAIAGIGTGPHPNSEPGIKKKTLKNIILSAKKVLKR